MFNFIRSYLPKFTVLVYSLINFQILTKTFNAMIKRLFMLFGISLILSLFTLAQDKKVDKQASAKAKKEA
jgi:hypothetical protein